MRAQLSSIALAVTFLTVYEGREGVEPQKNLNSVEVKGVGAELGGVSIRLYLILLAILADDFGARRCWGKAILNQDDGALIRVFRRYRKFCGALPIESFPKQMSFQIRPSAKSTPPYLFLSTLRCRQLGSALQ